MANVHVNNDGIELDSPIMVEGLPGVGLAGKLVTDHLIDEHDLEEYASVHCESIPQISVYQENDRKVHAPVRLSASADGSIVVLTSDVPVEVSESMEFIDGLIDWFETEEVLPIFLSGRPDPAAEEEEDGTDPHVFAVGCGDTEDRLADLDLPEPDEPGAISGPTGALLLRCAEYNMEAIGAVVDSNIQFPDPLAAKRLIENVVDPVTGLNTDSQALIDHANEIKAKREALAKSMQQAGQETSSQAQPLRMFQ